MKSFNKIASNLHKMQRRKKPQKLLSLARCSPLNNNTIAIVQKEENCSQTMENFGSRQWQQQQICETGDQSQIKQNKMREK